MTDNIDRLVLHPEIYTVLIKEKLYPDGYCDCSCGPAHHKLWWDERTDAARFYCHYHRRECGRVTGLEIRERLENAKARGAFT